MWFSLYICIIFRGSMILLVLSSCSLLSYCLSFLWSWAVSVDMAVSLCVYVLCCFSK